MKKIPLDDKDRELIQAAKDAITSNFKVPNHTIGAAIRTVDDQIFTSVNMALEFIKRAGTCAEPIALEKAIELKKTVKTIVAIQHPLPREDSGSLQIVPPCGICREVLMDYFPDMEVILAEDGELFKTSIEELLPYRYKRKK